MDERKVQRRPFRTLGMRMQNFGRQLIHNYMASTNLTASAELPPAWHDDAETPLVWRKPDAEQPAKYIDLDQGVDDRPPVNVMPQTTDRQPIRRKPTPPRPQPSQGGIDSRLSQILAFHDRRNSFEDTPTQEVGRPSPPPPDDIRRRPDEGHSVAPPSRRRRASIDYVETSALKPFASEIAASPAARDKTARADSQRDEPELDEEGESTREDRWDAPVDVATDDLPASSNIQRAPVSESSPSTRSPIDRAEVSPVFQPGPERDETQAHWDSDEDEALPHDSQSQAPFGHEEQEETVAWQDIDTRRDFAERDMPADAVQRMPDAPMQKSASRSEAAIDHDVTPDGDVSYPAETDARRPQDAYSDEDEAPRATIQRATDTQVDRSPQSEPGWDADGPEDTGYEQPVADTRRAFEPQGPDLLPVERAQRAPEPEQSRSQIDAGPDWDGDGGEETFGYEAPDEPVQRAQDSAFPRQTAAVPDMAASDGEESMALFEDIVDHQIPGRSVQRASEPQPSSRQPDAAPDWDSGDMDYDDVAEDESPAERAQRSQDPESWAARTDSDPNWDSETTGYEDRPGTAPTPPVETVQRAPEAPLPTQVDGASSTWEPDSVGEEEVDVVGSQGEFVQRESEPPTESTRKPRGRAAQRRETRAVDDIGEPETRPLEILGDEVAWEPEWVTDVGAAMPRPLNAIDERMQRAPDLFSAEGDDAEVDGYGDDGGPGPLRDVPPDAAQRRPEPQGEDYYYEDTTPEREEQSIDMYEAMVRAGLVEPSPGRRASDAPSPSDIARKPDPQEEDDDWYGTKPEDYEDGHLITDITTISPPQAEISPRGAESVISRAPFEESSFFVAPPQPEIRYTSPSPEVMREVLPSRGAQRPEPSQVEDEEQQPEGSGGEQNIEKLARSVYRVLRDRLRIERERGDRLQGR